MFDTKITIRVSAELLARIEAYRARAEADTGFHVTTADALRQLATTALDAAKARTGRTKKPQR